MLEGAGSGPDAAETYAKAFVPNTRHGVGLIIQGSACLYEEGRTSPGMTLVHSRDRMLAMTEMVRAVHDAGAAIFLQIGHGGGSTRWKGGTSRTRANARARCWRLRRCP